MKQETEQLEVLLPPVYLYEKIKDAPQIYFDFSEKDEIELNTSMAFPKGKLVIEKAWKENNSFILVIDRYSG